MSQLNPPSTSSGSVSTLSDLVFHVREISAARPDYLTVRHRDRRESQSASDFIRAVHSLAVALEGQGLDRGQRVAIFSENRPEWHVVDFACHLLGVPTVPIFSRLSREQVAFILRNSGVGWVFFSDSAKLDVLSSLKGALTQLPELVAFDGDANPPGGRTITRLMGDGAARLGEIPLERFRGRVDAEDLASILYTSGTTGDPKGVMLSHSNFVTNMISCSKLFELSPEDRALSFLPLSHVFQRTVDHLCFFRGVHIHYVPRLDDLLPSMADEKPTVLAAGPELYRRLYRIELDRVEALPVWRRRLFDWALDAGKRHAVAAREGFIGPISAIKRGLAHHGPLKPARELLGGRLQFAISGGAPLDEEVAEFFEAVGVPIYQGYGLTETSPVLATNSPDHQRIGSVGKPLSEVELRIAEDGEILVRGPGVMQGYWQNPAATAESINDSGWFRTGDLGRMDKSGYVFVTDRKRDLLTLSNGEQVAPRPIEALLVGGPILQAVVVGDGRPFAAALLVPNPRQAGAEGAEISQDRLKELVTERIDRANLQLPEAIRIQCWAFLDSELTVEAEELTPTHRLRRRKISQTRAKDIADLYRKG